MSGDGQRQPRKEGSHDDHSIKEFAETAMNELLGLYGYGKVDSRDTVGLSLHRYTNHSPLPQSSPANTSPPHRTSPATHSPTRQSSPANHSPTRHTRPGNHSPKRHTSPANQSPTRHSSPAHAQPKLSPLPTSVNHNHASDLEHDADSLDSEDMPVAGQSEQSVSPGKTEPGSSPCSTPKSDSGGGGGGGSGLVLCSWCSRVCGSGSEEGRGGAGGGAPFHLPTTSGDRHFCSEVCFTQCRRASFKKSKVCDWCRHVRPTVTYVDFTDGDHQLQFCSDKCLNQYKMQIFCRETEAHLQMHPHLHELKAATSSAASLITPDLWLRDCGIDGSNMPEHEAESPGSPPPSEESNEPVNLSTSQTARSSPAPPRLSPGPALSTHARSPAPLPPTPRYGRPRLRDRRDPGREMGRAKAGRLPMQPHRPNQADMDKPEEPPRPPTIRVRQLEAQPDATIQANSGSEGVGEREGDASPLPAPQPPGLPLGGLGGLLPMVGGSPLLLPHMLPPDLQRTPLLPHLLLQRPDLLRPPPLRHPLLSAPPPPAPPTPAPPAPAPPPQPAPHKTLGGLLPPVTVLLPIPIPIPIPIPVPIPFPFPPRTDPPEPRPAPPPRPRVAPRKDLGRPTSVINGAPTVPGPATPATPGPAPAPPPLPPPPTANCDAAAARPDRERRSILRYTSDVYEINGVFLPRDSAWDAPEPLHLRRALTSDAALDGPHNDPFPPQDESRSPTPDHMQDSKESLAALTCREDEASTARRLLGDDEDTKVTLPAQVAAGSAAGPAAGSTAAPVEGPVSETSGGRKRPAAPHAHPLPKKKHLLV